MLFDHFGDAIFHKFSFFNLIGRISFPIFAFQLVNGYIHTKNLKNYIIKMFIFSLIAQVPFILFLSTFSNEIYLNIFFTFTLGLIALFIYDKCNNKFLGLLCVLIISYLAYLIKVDYGAFGILSIFIFYIFVVNTKKYRKLLMSISFILLSFAYYLPNIISSPTLLAHYFLCILFTCLSLIFILFYNRKEGPKLKYFFYIFYPLHLTILYLLNFLI